MSARGARGRAEPSPPPCATPLDKQLDTQERGEYLKFLGTYLGRARDTRLEMEDSLASSKAENKHLEGWLAEGQRSRVSYLLSLVDESNYVRSDPSDAVFLERLATLRAEDAKRRRTLKPLGRGGAQERFSVVE